MTNGNVEMPLEGVSNGFTPGYCDALTGATQVVAHQLAASSNISGTSGMNGADLIDICLLLNFSYQKISVSIFFSFC